MDHPLRTLFCTLVLWAAGDVAAFDQKPFDVPPNRVLLTLAPAPENPRNSEGAFATLGSGRIIFCYSSYYGGKGEPGLARFDPDGSARRSRNDA